MSETTNPIAEAMASMDAVQPAAIPDSAPQAEPIAETPAEPPAPSASAEESTDAVQPDDSGAPTRAEKRIQQLLQREREARERIAYLEGLNQRNPAPAQPQPEQQAAQVHQDLAKWLGDEPKPDAFPAGEFDPQYLRAIAKFEARAEQAQFVMAQRQHAARQAEQSRAQAFAEAVAAAEKASPDFREVVGGLGHRLPNWQADLIADAGAEIAYAIGKDAEAEERIRAMRSPVQVAREIGRIEARMASASAPPPPTPQPSAAPPPPPRAVRGASAVGFDWSKASPAEIQARINAR